MRWSAILRTGVVAIAIGGANELRGQSLLEPLNPFEQKFDTKPTFEKGEESPSSPIDLPDPSKPIFASDPAADSQPSGGQKLFEISNPLAKKSDADAKKSDHESEADSLFGISDPLSKKFGNNAASKSQSPPPLNRGTAAENWKGTWRDPERLIIEGAKHFDAKQIRQKLLADLDVMDARHPLAPKDEYPKVLAERCRAGYLHSGFADAKVDARLDENDTRVVVTIDEGPESLCGDVNVEGAIYFKPYELATWLTSKQPPAGAHPTGLTDTDEGTVIGWVTEDGENAELESPAWDISQPLRADDGGKQKLHDKIARGLAELGLPWAEFEFTYSASKQPLFKNLQIKVTDEGEPAVVGGIEVIGNKRDSAEDVIQFLGVKPGMLLRESARLLLWQKLWMSGRYRFQNVELVPPSPFGDPVKLQITVWEYAQVTPIKQPLNDVESALLKCRDWILAARDRGEDFVFRISGGQNYSFVASADTQLLFRIDADKAESATPQGETELPNVLLAVTSNKLLFINNACPNIFSRPIDGKKACFNFSMGPAFDSAKPDKDDFSFTIGAGLNSRRGCCSLSFAPVAILSLAYKGDPKCQLDGDALSIASEAKGSIIRIDRRTGELLECSAKGTDDSNSRLSFCFKKAAFEEEFATAKDSLADRLTSAPSGFDPARPISSMAEFVLRDENLCVLSSLHEDTSKEQISKLAHLARKLTAAGLLRPVDAWCLSLESDDDSAIEFTIPGQVDASKGFFGQITTGVCILMADISEQGFPEDSWPAVLLRAAANIGRKRAKYVESDIRLLLSSKHFGPLGHLVAAEMMRALNCRVSELFAKRGLATLSANEFRNDFAPLTDPNTPAGKAICSLALILRELDDNEAQELGDLALGENGHILVDFVRGIRECNLQPIEEALPTLLPIAWNRGLKQVIEQRLHTLAGDDVSVATKPAESDEQNRKK